MNRPYVICHILSALDGKIDGEFFRCRNVFPHCSNSERYAAFTIAPPCCTEQPRWKAAMPTDGSERFPKAMPFISVKIMLPKSDVKNYIVSLDPQGALAFRGKYLEKKNRPRAHIIEALTEQVSDGYLSYLRSLDISYVIAGKERLDCSMLLEKLKTLFGIEKLMISSGGLTNWSFVQENLIDEFSLVIAPVADGSRDTASVFERANFLPHRTPAAFTLKAVERIDGDTLWLRYLLKKQNGS